VQIGRTFGNGARHQGLGSPADIDNPVGSRLYAFAPSGEQTSARMILHAIGQARKFIYIEDQYFVDTAPNEMGLSVREALISALQKLQHVTVLVPDGRITDLGPPLPNQVHYRRNRLIAALRKAGEIKEPRTGKVLGNKFRIFMRNPAPNAHTYVHAKTWIFDDEFAIIGSANCNRRSWTHDSEVVAGICDAGNGKDLRMPHRLRMRLWKEHLNLPSIDLVRDGVNSADLWLNWKHTYKVLLYPDYKDEPAWPGRDKEWDTIIDPDGS
jgi:phosphatidylserine/phosphatidylglycerophosphate/cardiolipin synthase-like enzyme